MHRLILIICGLALTICPFATSEEISERTGITMRSLEFCPIALSEAGRRASFSCNAIYKSEVGKDGKIAKLTPVIIPDVMPHFVQLGEFESCIKSWRFQDPGEYTIQFSAGTKGEKWKINVTTKGKFLTIILQ